MASKEIAPQAEEVLSQSSEGECLTSRSGNGPYPLLTPVCAVKKGDVDVALDLYIQAQGVDHASKEEEAAVLRKIDLHLQP